MLLVPEAFRNHPDLMKEYPEVVDFYEFFEGLQEGWDGPALLVFSDGKRVGARLDRNGLRPARFWRTADDTIYVASEVGGSCTSILSTLSHRCRGSSAILRHFASGLVLDLCCMLR